MSLSSRNNNLITAARPVLQNGYNKKQKPVQTTEKQTINRGLVNKILVICDIVWLYCWSAVRCASLNSLSVTLNYQLDRSKTI